VETNITVALAGNPNSGKTTVFNNLTGTRQHVGNWPGVTVEKKEGNFRKNGCNVKVVDLPGTYSLTAYSMEEIVARDFVVKECPDVVVDIVDASNLERNLYLAVQMIELGANVVIALNMMDVAESKGVKIDVGLLSELLGAPVVATVASKKQGMNELIQTAIRSAKEKSPKKEISVSYGKEVEDEIERITELIEKNRVLLQDYQPRWLAVKLLEEDKVITDAVAAATGGEEVIAAAGKSREHISGILVDEPRTIIADRRYGFISGLVKEAVSRPTVDRRNISDKIDAVITNRVLGLPIFLALMWLTFQLTFTAGTPPMDWIDAAFGWLGEQAGAALGDTLIGSLVVDGIIGGVGGVVIFLPNILLLFFAIALLEDSGYMARAAFIMDRFMHSIGLHGKSFIPMLIGIGCSVPAVMATRTLENRRDRMVTILIVPLMSCGARLPVYILLAGAFFHPKAAGNVIFSMYVIGIVLAIVMAKVFRKFLFPGPSSPFVMELPPYRIPTAKSVLIHMWERGWLYLKKAGTIILAISVILWFLMAFPQSFKGQSELETKLEAATAEFEQQVEGKGLDVESEEYRALYEPVVSLENEISGRQLENSFAGRAGRALEPAFRPVGLDWKSGIAVVAGFAAKEVVVSTLGTLYSIGEADEESEGLREAIRKDPLFNPLVAFVLMLFVLISVPCMATIAIIKRETNSWKWPLFSIAYHTALAWFICFVVYQIGRAAGLGMG